MVHEMKLQDKYFNAILSGKKTIELRLYDEKRRQVKVGDTIIFRHMEMDKTIETEVIALHKFSSFEELYKNFDKEKLGYKEDEIANPEDMKQYYSKEQIEVFGVVGIEIKKK